VPQLIQKGNTSVGLEFLMVDSTDHRTGKTGLSPTVLLWKEDASGWVSADGSVEEIGYGLYRLNPTAEDVDTLGTLLLHATSAGADPADVTFTIVSYDPLLNPVNQADSSVEGNLVTEVRQAVGDWGEYQTHIVPRGVIDGVNKRFQSSLMPLGGGTKLFDATGNEITSGYSLNVDTGLLVYETAPATGSGHYLEGNVYRYRTSYIQWAIGAAARHLYGVWGADKYPVSLSGTELTFATEPTGIDRAILVLMAAREVLTGQQAYAAAQGMRLTDGLGAVDTTRRAADLQQLLRTLQAKLSLLVRDAGYTLPRFAAIDYASDFEGQVWAAEDVGNIV